MKKFLCLMVAALLVVGLTSGCNSCSSDVHFGIEYSLQSNGTANGDVAVTFEGGSFSINGDAKYTFSWENTILLTKANNVVSLEQALVSKYARIADTAKKVDDWLNSSINVTAAGGTYDLYVKGYVKETATGLTFEIDRHFTNIPENPAEELLK